MCEALSMLLNFLDAHRGTLALRTMADLAPTTLKDLWQSGQQGRLSPWQVARALALREASKECHGGPSWVGFRFLGFRYSEQRHAEGSDRLGGLLPFETLAEGNLVLSLSASAGTPMLVSAF